MTTHTSERPWLVAKARRAAEYAHRDHIDKGGSPYVGHLERVAAMVAPDEKAQAVAWLHDLVEDQPQCARLLHDFPHDVVRSVYLLTKTKGEPNALYFERIKADPVALKVKLADIADNMGPERLAKLDDATQERLREKYAKALAALSRGEGRAVAWRVANHADGPFALRKTEPSGWAVIEPLFTHPAQDNAAIEALGAGGGLAFPRIRIADELDEYADELLDDSCEAYQIAIGLHELSARIRKDLSEECDWPDCGRDTNATGLQRCCKLDNVACPKNCGCIVHCRAEKLHPPQPTAAQEPVAWMKSIGMARHWIDRYAIESLSHGEGRAVATLVGIANIPPHGNGVNTQAIFDARAVPPGTKLYTHPAQGDNAAQVDDETIARARESFWSNFPIEDRDAEWYAWANMQIRRMLTDALSQPAAKGEKE